MPLSCTATYKLDELKQLGITPTPLEIVTLNDLGLAVDNAGASVLARERGLPVSVGGTKLWTMTALGASVWETWAEWFGGSGMMSTAALAFILAHGRGEPVTVPSLFQLAKSVLKVTGQTGRTEHATAVQLDQVTDRATALRCILYWFSRLTCTIAELDAATSRLLDHQESTTRATAKLATFTLLDRYADNERFSPVLDAILDDLTAQDKKASPTYDSLTWVQYCNDLSVMTGTDPLYWLHTDRREVVRCYALAVEARLAAAGGSQDVLTPTEKAIKALQAEVADIIKRRTKAPESI